MNRFEMTLPERLASIAWRYQTPLAVRWSSPATPWLVALGGEEDDPAADGPTARSGQLARLEAVLFLTREPMGTRKLAELADLADGTQARTLVRKLNRLYDEEGCAFRAIEVAGGFQLLSRPQFASYLRRFHGPALEVRLSAPAMETLSVVAYRQPVLRTTIESIRGVQCGELLRQLMERDLVRITGRSEELGRPYLYGTTKRFLQVFGLRHLDELPPVETELAIDEPPGGSEAGEPGDGDRPDLAAPSEESPLTGEESTVKIEIEGQETTLPVEELSQSPAPDQTPKAEVEDDTSFDDEDDYDEEDEDDEDYEYEDEDEDDDFEDSDEEYEEDDEGFEDSDWEEVEEDEEDDDDWDDEDEEWDDDDDDEEDWDDEDEDEDDWD